MLRSLDPSDKSKSLVDDSAQLAFDSHLMRWFDCEPEAGLKGVALVIHGLNLRPNRMLPIISSLKQSGIAVMGVSLHGHGDNYVHLEGLTADEARLKSFKSVSYQLWHNEIYRAFTNVKKRAEQHGVPVFLVAYSLGALLGLDLLASRSEVHFDRMALFAPALQLRGFYYLGRVFSPFERIVIKSLGPESYLANAQGTPIGAYNVLFNCLRHFNSDLNPKINVPALVLMDSKDELISARKLQKFIQVNRLDQWRYYHIRKGRDIKFGTFHHHIIDAYSTGKAVWQDITRAVANSLLKIPSP